MIEAFLAKIGEIFAEKATETAIDKAKGTYFSPKMKRILLISVCACVLLFGIGCFFYFGYRFTWSLDDKGVLTIEKGFLRHKMPEYSYKEPKDQENYNADMYPIFVSKFPWFNRREEITHIILPDGLTNISPAAFAGCGNLQEIYIPDSLTTIGEYSFNDCYRLEHIPLNNVAYIRSFAFNQCHSLKSVRFYFDFDFMNYDKDISDGYIGECAFRNCSNLERIYIPNRFTHIKDLAFMNCYSLPEITIPFGLTHIGNLAFDNCISLTEIYIPNSVTKVCFNAFEGCKKLETASVPAGAEIEEYAFPEWTTVTVRES